MNKWAHIFRWFSRNVPGFAACRNMHSGPSGIVFRTAVPYPGGFLYRSMFAISPDGRIFGPRSREVDEAILLAWFRDPKGLSDFC